MNPPPAVRLGDAPVLSVVMAAQRGISGAVELRQLRAFLLLAEELHFSRAAQRLGISQPTLSEQVRRLEADVGVKLLERTTRHVQVTPAGDALKVGAAATLAAADEALDAARRAAGGEPSSVRLGVTRVSTAEVVPALSRAMRDRTIAVTVAAKEGRMHELTAGVLRGRLDAGLALCPPEEDRLAYQVIKYERMIVALPEDHPAAGRAAVTVHDLRESEILTYPAAYPSTFGYAVAAAWRRCGLNPTLRGDLGYDESPAVVVGRAAVSIVPNGLTAAAIPAGVALSRLHPPTAFPLVLFWPRDSPAPGLRLLIRALRELSRRAGWLRGAPFGVPLPFD